MTNCKKLIRKVLLEEENASADTKSYILGT